MNARSRWLDVISGQDPAHARLTVAVAVTTGVLLSAIFGEFSVRVLHAQTSLVSVSIMLSVQAGTMVKDSTAHKRMVTSALLVPALVISILVASALSAQRPLISVGFIVVTGAAIWVRKYGSRAAAIGAISFMGYFFTLFIKPAPDELLIFCLIAAVAVVSQLLIRVALLLRRPRRELEVLLQGLRAASTSAIHAALPPAGRTDERHGLRMALARLDSVGAAIASWQDRFQTERYVAIDEETLAELVLDARVETEEACYERARRGPVKTSAGAAVPSTPEGVRAERALMTILDDHATTHRFNAARETVVEMLKGDDTKGGDLEAQLLARSGVAHARLRDVDLSHPLSSNTNTITNTRARAGLGVAPATPALTAQPAHTTQVGPASVLVAAPAAPNGSRSGARAWSWTPWHSWAPTTRMAVQATIAALLAAGVGEAISASRWYWAVMTAFVIFIGGNTRSSIFTRAYRRVAGTAIGIALGIGLVVLAGSDNALLVTMCIVAVFGMLYFGPLSYLYQAVFTTMMLVTLYRLLGVLGGSILEVRLIETISGAVIGVLCAYLIFSATSRPALLGTIDAYFAALDHLLGAVVANPRGDPGQLLSLLRALEDAQSQADKTASAMSAALAVRGPHEGSDAVHDMFLVSRAAARLVQTVVTDQTPRADADVVAHALTQAVKEVRQTAATAQRLFHGEAALGGEQPTDTLPLIVEHLRNASLRSPIPLEAISALARIDWALRRFIKHSEAAGWQPQIAKLKQVVQPHR